MTSRDLDASPSWTSLWKSTRTSPLRRQGCLSLTGYQGILGYRTQTDTQSWSDAQEANRQKEIQAVKPIIAELKRTGWTFGSHTWGHIRLGTKSLESIQADTQRWFDEVGSLVGPTTILFYPHGERPDGNDWQNTAGIPLPPEPGVPGLRLCGHRELQLYQEGHLRRHLRPAPPGRHHPAPLPGPVLAILRRQGYYGCRRTAPAGDRLGLKKEDARMKHRIRSFLLSLLLVTALTACGSGRRNRRSRFDGGGGHDR